jgi:hypothetical protein
VVIGATTLLAIGGTADLLFAVAARRLEFLFAVRAFSVLEVWWAHESITSCGRVSSLANKSENFQTPAGIS